MASKFAMALLGRRYKTEQAKAMIKKRKEIEEEERRRAAAQAAIKKRRYYSDADSILKEIKAGRY